MTDLGLRSISLNSGRDVDKKATLTGRFFYRLLLVTGYCKVVLRADRCANIKQVMPTMLSSSIAHKPSR